MPEGRLESIHIATAAASPMQGLMDVQAVAGEGLAGDRYGAKRGTFSGSPKPGRQVTFIEAEAIEALVGEQNLHLAAGESRRNLVTRGVPLNHLVGREFQIGEARFRGYELCEPCEHLAKLSGKPGILPGLVHRGGIRAEILQGGLLRVGDPIHY